MAKTKQQKQDMLQDYTNRLGESTGVIVLSQSGLSPNQINEFKKQLFDFGATYQTVKNTIFKIALENSELPELETFNAGPNSVVYTTEDVAGIAKLVAEFIKENKEKVEIKAGILDGQELTLQQVKDLAELPTKEQSVAMIAGILQQHVSGIMNVLEDNVRSIAIILDKAFTE